VARTYFEKQRPRRRYIGLLERRLMLPAMPELIIRRECCPTLGYGYQLIRPHSHDDKKGPLVHQRHCVGDNG